MHVGVWGQIALCQHRGVPSLAADMHVMHLYRSQKQSLPVTPSMHLLLTHLPTNHPCCCLVSKNPVPPLLLVTIMRRGGTVSRTRTGSVLHRFASRLPAGGPCSHQGGFCVLDCIFQEQHLQPLPQEQANQQQQQQQADVDMAGSTGNGIGNSIGNSSSSSTVGAGGTYYIQDVLVWRGYSLVDCGADFRLFWLTSKLAEEVSWGSWTLDGGPAGPGHQFR